MLEPAASKDLLGTLGLNGKLFLAQLVNFSIVLVVMWKWVYTPLVKLMDTRAKAIKDGLAQAQLAQQKLTEASVEKERTLRAAQADAQALLEAARAKADALHQEKLRQARLEIEKIVEETKQRIQHERAESLRDLQREVVDLTLQATRKVMHGLDETVHKALLQQAIKDIDKV